MQRSPRQKKMKCSKMTNVNREERTWGARGKMHFGRCHCKMRFDDVKRTADDKFSESSETPGSASTDRSAGWLKDLCMASHMRLDPVWCTAVEILTLPPSLKSDIELYRNPFWTMCGPQRKSGKNSITQPPLLDLSSIQMLSETPFVQIVLFVSRSAL